jgi:hypothetical protein
MLNQIDLKPVMYVLIMQSWPWMSLGYMAVLSGVAAEMGARVYAGSVLGVPSLSLVGGPRVSKRD